MPFYKVELKLLSALREWPSASSSPTNAPTSSESAGKRNSGSTVYNLFNLEKRPLKLFFLPPEQFGRGYEGETGLQDSSRAVSLDKFRMTIDNAAKPVTAEIKIKEKDDKGTLKLQIDKSEGAFALERLAQFVLDVRTASQVHGWSKKVKITELPRDVIPDSSTASAASSLPSPAHTSGGSSPTQHPLPPRPSYTQLRPAGSSPSPAQRYTTTVDPRSARPSLNLATTQQLATAIAPPAARSSSAFVPPLASPAPAKRAGSNSNNGSPLAKRTKQVEVAPKPTPVPAAAPTAPSQAAAALAPLAPREAMTAQLVVLEHKAAEEARALAAQQSGYEQLKADWATLVQANGPLASAVIEYERAQDSGREEVESLRKQLALAERKLKDGANELDSARESHSKSNADIARAVTKRDAAQERVKAHAAEKATKESEADEVRKRRLEHVKAEWAEIVKLYKDCLDAENFDALDALKVRRTRVKDELERLEEEDVARGLRR